MTETENVSIVGFDLGHGETALARVHADRDGDPEMLELYGRKNQVTAVGRHPDKGVVIGERALILPEMTSFEICFKQRPTDDPLFRRNIQDFVSACHAHLVTQNQIKDGNGVCYYVGCPSGWPDDVIIQYENLLREARLPSLRVIRESRAALLHAKEGGKLTLGELKRAVLIVDLGSSTTDFTVVRGAQEQPLDFGGDLGAALIDQAILRHTLGGHEHRPELEQIFAEHALHRARCEMQCRKAKETYFSNEDLYEDPGCFVQSGFERIQKLFVFEPKVNGAIMQHILSSPLPELEGCSWIQRFTELAAAAKERLDADGIKPSVLLLTGGASRMDFVRSVCKSTFIESDVRRDSEPEFCIARGLARWGRVDLRTTAFQEEVEGFLSELDEMIVAAIPQLKQHLGQCLVAGLLEDVVQVALRAWRDGEVTTLAKLEPHMRSLAESWIDSDAARSRIAKHCGKWFAPIQQQLNAQTDRICQNHRVPVGALALDASLDNIPLVDIPDIHPGSPSTAANIVNIGAAISALIVASILGGGGWAILMSGPIGWCIGLVVGVVAAYYGKSQTESYLQDLAIPVMIRKAILRDNQIVEQARQTKPKLRSEIERQLENLKEPFEELILNLKNQLRACLQAKTDEARLMIK